MSTEENLRQKIDNRNASAKRKTKRHPRALQRGLLLCLAAAMTLAMCGCRKSGEEALPQLVIGCGDDEPYNYTDADGEPAGIDVELAREACARMGYEPVFRQIDWNARDTYLEDGTVDCLWSCLSMDGQEEAYSWVGPYMRSRQIVAVLRDSPIQTLSDLEGKNIAVRVGGKAERIFLGHTNAVTPTLRNVYSQSSMDEVATALRNDYVDAVAGYAATVREALQSYDVPFRFLEEDLSHASLGIAFARGSDRELRRKLKKALEEMRWDGTTKRILEGYGVDTDKALNGLSRHHNVYGGYGDA